MAFRFVDETPAYKFVDEPQSRPLPANAGLANFAATVAGIPMDTVQNVVNLTRAAQGTAATAMGLHDWAPPLMSNIPGGSENIKNMLRSTGEKGLSPDNPSPESRSGTRQYDFMTRGGFIPGAAIPAGASMVAEEALGPQWGGVGALLSQLGVNTYNAMRAPSLKAQEAKNAVRDKTFKEGREAGLVAPPSATGGGAVSNVIESFGGKEAMGQKSAIKNQEATNVLAREHAGLPENTAISVEALKNRRQTLSAPYRELRQISPSVSKTLDDLQDVRAEATGYWQEYQRQGTMASLREARKLDLKADALENNLEQAATKSGRPDLVPSLRDARQAIAKTHDVERALNLGTGDVSAPVLGRMLDSGKKLTGGLEKAAKFQQAFPHFMREGEKVPSPDVSATNLMASGMLGYGGFQTMGWPGLAMAALPFARGAARSALLSKPVQNSLVKSYRPALSEAPPPALLYQLGIVE